MKRRKNRRISWFLALCMLLTVLQTPLVALAEEMQMPQPTETASPDEAEQTPVPEQTPTPEQSPALQEAAEQAQEEKAAAVPAVQTVEEDGLNTDAEGYLLITGADELAKVMNDTATYADKNLRLTGSLDMAGQAVQPLGNSSTPFTGTFDGAGYTISNLKIQASGGYTGMFGRMDGTVKDLTLNKADIEDTNESYTKGTGALAGHNKGTISDCLVKNSEIKVHYNGLGGLVGYNEGTAERCGVENSTITAASVASMAYTGGFAGQNAAKGSLIQCYVEGGKVCYTGVAAKGQEVGGFVGRNASSTSVIQNCYSTAEVAANGDKAGGFIGNANAGSIENCFATGDVNGRKYVGGFAGDLGYGSCTLSSCYALGKVVSTGTSSGKYNYFGKFYGNGMSPKATNCLYNAVVSITGNGTEAEQNAAFTAMTEAEIQQAASLLGANWTADAEHNNGFPYLKNVKAPENRGTTPSGPQKLATPAGLSWDNTVLSWKAVPNAVCYTLVLYKEQASGKNEQVAVYVNVTETSKDFAGVFTVSGSYYVTVQAVGNGTDTTDSDISAQSPAYTYVNRDEQGFILIKTPEELLALAEKTADLSQNYKLANDIDMTGYTGKVIGKYSTGSDSKAFTGIFDGDGHTISNLSLAGEGLFSYVGQDGIVRNLTLKKAAVEDGQSNSMHSPAALVCRNKGEIENCYVKQSTVVSVYNACTGGLVGINEGTVRYSGVDGGSVVCKSAYSTKIGGFVGRNLGSIEQCYAATGVSGAKWVGGFVGGQEGGTVRDCYAIGQVTATNEQAGGFAGFFITYTSGNPSVLENVYASCDVRAKSGGPVAGGNNTVAKAGEGTAKNCYYNSYKVAPETQGMALEAAVGKTTSEMKTAAFAALLGGDVWAVDSTDKQSVINNGYPYLLKATPDAAAPVQEKIEVSLLIAPYDQTGYCFVPGKVLTVQTAGESITVKDVMDAAQQAGLLTYKAAQSSYGYYVSAINGTEPESPSGWMFTINDKVSGVGMSAAQVHPGDKILWYEGTASNHYAAPTWEKMTAPEPPVYEDIYTKEQLMALAESKNPAEDWKKNYRLMADIDLAGVAFTPIGTEDIPFAGIFEGNGKTIANMTVTKGEGSENLGLFGCIEGASILNLTLKNANVTGGSRMGALVGVAKADAEKELANLIGNCHVTGTVYAKGTTVIKQTDAGGLVGVNEGATDSQSGRSIFSAIDACTADVTVKADTGAEDKTQSGHVGGFVGWNKGTITKCAASGQVLGGNTTGGFAGSNFGSIYLSHATGNVTAGYTAGGFVGSSGVGSTMENCYATGNVVANAPNSGAYFGGFAGAVSGKVKNCVSTGTLTPGWSYNGGFAGYYEGTLSSFNENFVTISRCYGNCETSLDTTIKALGNYIEGKDENSDKAAQQMAVSRAEAEQKLKEMLQAVAEEQQTAEALVNEAEKYEEEVKIPSTVAAQTDVTNLVARLKPGQTADDSIAVQYRERTENTYITSTNPANRYTLARTYDKTGKTEETVVLLFTQNGQTATKTVKVSIQGSKNQATMADILASLQKRYTNPAYDDSLSDWVAFDMGAYVGAGNVFASKGAKNSFIANALENIRPNIATDYERVILMMTALGVDAQTEVDTLAKLPKERLESVNAQAFALLAYDAADYTLPEDAINTREAAIAYLLSKENADGGWAYEGSVSEASMTAMVLSALAPYKDRADVQAALEKGVDCLSNLQLASGGYGYEGTENSNDDAMVVLALTSLGIDAGSDARFVKNGNSVLSNMMSFVTEDKQFGYEDNTEANAYATEQCFRALIAYSRYQAKGYNVYRFEGKLEERVLPGKVTVTVKKDAQLPEMQGPDEKTWQEAVFTQEDWERIANGENAQIFVTMEKAATDAAQQWEKKDRLLCAWTIVIEKEIGGQRQTVTTLQQPVQISVALEKPWRGHASYAVLAVCNGQASEVNGVKEEDGCVVLEVQSGGFYALAYAEANAANGAGSDTSPQMGDTNRTAFFWMLLLLSSLGLAAAMQSRKTAVKKQ